MGNLEDTCGALIGAVMVAGLKTEGKGTLQMARRIQETFRERCGAIKCRGNKVTEEEKMVPSEMERTGAIGGYYFIPIEST